VAKRKFYDRVLKMKVEVITTQIGNKAVEMSVEVQMQLKAHRMNLTKSIRL